LGFGALTAAARVRFPVREAVFWPPLALTRRERPAKSNSSFEPESNQRPKDVCLFNYSPPLYQLSYRRSWRWSGQDFLLCPSHDPKRVFILAPHTVSKTCHKSGLSRWGDVSCFEEILTVSLQMRQVKLE